jgi:hypothetical protein
MKVCKKHKWWHLLFGTTTNIFANPKTGQLRHILRCNYCGKKLNVWFEGKYEIHNQT